MNKKVLPRPRPTFVLRSSEEPQAIRTRVAAFLHNDEHIRGLVHGNRLEFAFVAREQHLWSPQLIVDLSAAPDGGGTFLRARFGPHPDVWMTYTAVYFILGFLAVLAASFGAAQAMMKASPTALWALPILAVLTALTYGVPFIGQGLGFEQMYLLRAKLAELSDGVEAADEPPASAEASTP